MERANYQSPAVSEGFYFARSLSSLNALIIVSMFDLIQKKYKNNKKQMREK